MANKGRTIKRISLGLLGLGLIWRTVRYALAFPLWGDEAFLATSFYERGFGDMLTPLEYSQIAPLGFMWCQLAVVRLLGLSEPALRLLPYLVGLASLLLYWRLATRILGRRSAMLAIGVFAVSYFPMRYGAEAKPYGMDLLVSLVLTYLGWLVIQRPEHGLRWVLLTIAAASAVWLSYPSVFVAGSVGLALTYRLVARPSGKFLAGWCAYGLSLVASFYAMLTLYAGQHFEAASWLAEIPMWQSAFPPLTEPWHLPLWLLDTHTGELLAYPFGSKHGGSTLPCLLVVVGSMVMWRRRRQVVLLLLGPLTLTFVAAAMHRYPYGGGPRVSLYMAPAFCLLIGVGLEAMLARFLPRRSLPKALRITATVLACIAIGGMVRDIVKPYKGRADLENRRVIRELAGQAAPDDRWATFNSLTDVPHAPNIAAWGGSGARFRYYLTTLAPVPVTWSPPPSDLPEPTGGQTVLLVYKDNKSPFPQDLLKQYLRAAAARLGPPRQSSFTLNGAEAIEVYVFTPQ